ncbi:chondroitin sulfate synthase 3-like [Varroa jacobsoni]|uniref:chondroitin sulfate synthase 3-like n=1 Tax=Varroa jacobsoni TaxID=62625 RepID=UPI000BF9E906|nr:chondroitin sulfate synthase 3-like [Varroa jacobsoni]XP_022692401.1 chondroitin sulfate synthase 3-like [Varroa jacobsoni]XP_022692403.1 chondroitin sulfate synthase 3-like [Varroa jacobsoni]
MSIWQPLLIAPDLSKRGVGKLRRSQAANLFSLMIGCLLGFLVTSQFLLWIRYNSSCDNGLWEVARRTSRRLAQKLVSADIIGESGLLFTGVMTAQRYIDSRAVAIYDTWGQGAPGGLLFFSSDGTTSKHGLPLVALRSVDDSYPPQKKSFMMLKYMYDNLLDKYDWFMRCDDDVYVHTERLELFLRSINSTKAHFLGQAGLGNKAEHGQLNLGPNQNFCMGGPGMIMSRKTLSLIGPHIKYCLEHLYSTHEDVEVGRCVHKFAGIPCTWSYEMQSIFHNNFGGEIEAEALSKNVLQKVITLHPIKRPRQMYLMHRVFLRLKSAELRHQLIELERDARQMLYYQGDHCQLLDGDECPSFDRSVLQHPLKQFKPVSLHDIQTWDFFSKNLYSPASSNPRRRIEEFNEIAINEVISDLMAMINRYSKQRGRVIDYRDVVYGYMRYTPTQGMDFVLDLLLSYRKFRGRRMSIPVRRHAYLRRSFASPLVRLVEENDLKKVHFIVPLAGRSEAFKRFLQTYEANCVLQKHFTALAVVYFQNSDARPAEEEDPKLLLEAFRIKYKNHDVRLVEASGQFSRAQALEIGAKLFSLDALLFFVDVDMIFDDGLVRRIAWNTQQGRSVYFPIVFSQYDPAQIAGSEKIVPTISFSKKFPIYDNASNKNSETRSFVASGQTESANNAVGQQTLRASLNNSSTLTSDGIRLESPLELAASAAKRAVTDDRHGYWRHFGFGIVGIYHSDLMLVGGLDTTIEGWGKEDVELFDKIVASNLTVFRAPDPGLIHVFHPIHCALSLSKEQAEMCRGTKLASTASWDDLGARVERQFPDLLSD